MSVIDREFQGATGITDIKQGLLPMRGSPTATEIATRSAESAGLFDVIARNLETQIMEPLLAMVYWLIVQYMDDFSDPAIREAVGEEEATRLSLLTPRERYEYLKGNYTFEARGMSVFLSKSQELQKIIDVLRNFGRYPMFLQVTNIPKLVSSDNIEAALDIDNPGLKISAPTAILFNAGTGEVLYFKNPVTAVFPASTAKLLSVLVALDWCKKEEQITVGNEITLIASDSSKANLKKGEVITAYTLMEAMLLPSGNDAAYVMAAYVGRKSLQNPKAKNIDAVREFVNLMNEKAKELGAENSCFVTPDGYDAIGQYTTAYDMGLIGVAAVNSWTIQSIAKLCTAKKTLISGEKYIWNNTNALIKKDSKWYYPNAVGLKTGSTTMAGGCLISAARNGDDVVVSVIMNSAGDGRWTDSIKLLTYGLNKLDSGYSFK
jgi:D-alanyl-D-alanine carboxypeptidase (penicillin-binding protein 5/6)